MIHEIWLSDPLYLQQEMKSVTGSGGTIHYASPFTFFAPAQTVSPFRLFLPASQLVLNQSVSVQKKLHFSIVTSLPLYSRGNTVYNVSVNSAFFCWQTLSRLFFPLSSSLTFNQSVVVHRTKGTSSQIAFASNVQVAVRFSKTHNLNLNLKSSVVGYMLNDDIILQPIPTTTQPDNVTLMFQDLELQLRRPIFGNLDRMSYSKISRRLRGNKLEIHREASWPKFERITFDFEHLTQKKVQEAQYFFKRSLGKDISIIDFQGVSWVGFVTTPEIEIVQNKRSGFTISFELEGVQT